MKKGAKYLPENERKIRTLQFKFADSTIKVIEEENLFALKQMEKKITENISGYSMV